MIEHYPFDKFAVSAVQRAKKNKSCCGDSFFIHETEDYLICALADGLGSGPEAHAASMSAINVVVAHHTLPLDELMDMINRSLCNLRGAVVTVFRVDYQNKMVQFSGVGNIKLTIYPVNGKSITPLSKPGFLSGRPLRFQVQQFAYPEQGLFVIHSDGVRLLSKQIPAIKKIYSADEPVATDVYLNDLMKDNETDDMTLLIGKPCVRAISYCE